MLTRKQQLFVEAYIRTSNGTQSAIAAGYSRKSARAIASENLKKIEIFREVEKRASERLPVVDAEREKFMRHIECIAFAPIDDLIGRKATAPKNSGRAKRCQSTALRLKLSALNTWWKHHKDYRGYGE